MLDSLQIRQHPVHTTAVSHLFIPKPVAVSCSNSPRPRKNTMTLLKWFNHLLALPLLGLNWLYRKCARPLMPGQCRFYPSCGDFSHQALQRHGFLGGVILTLHRVIRCHPYHLGGSEPVPKKLHWRYFFPVKDSNDETLG